MFDPEYRQFLKFFYLFKKPARIKEYFRFEIDTGKMIYEFQLLKIKIIYDNGYMKDKFMSRLNDGYLRYGKEINYVNLFSFFYKDLSYEY